MAKDVVFDFMDASKTGTDVLKYQKENKKRIRPSLATYRELERRLNVANGHIELGTKQLSDLQMKHDIQEAANKELVCKLSEYLAKIDFQKLDIKRIETALSLADQTSEKWRKEVCSLSDETIGLAESWSKTSLWAFLLSIVTIICSAIQISHAL